MKLPPKLFLLSIFIIFLISGLITGRAAARAGKIFRASYAGSQAEELSAHNKTGYPIPAVFNPDAIAQQGDLDNSKQRSILIITVDDLSANGARLDTIWLILYIPNLPEITLIPIYPKINPSEDSIEVVLDYDLKTQFKLEPRGILDPMFLALLRENGVSWSKYIILDRATINQIDQFATNLKIDNPTGSNHDDLSSIIPDKELTPTERILSHAKIAQNVCQHYTELMLTPDTVLRYFPRLVQSIETDFNTQEAAYEIWTIEEAMAGFKCGFPSFSAMNVLSNKP